MTRDVVAGDDARCRFLESAARTSRTVSDAGRSPWRVERVAVFTMPAFLSRRQGPVLAILGIVLFGVLRDAHQHDDGDADRAPHLLRMFRRAVLGRVVARRR